MGKCWIFLVFLGLGLIQCVPSQAKEKQKRQEQKSESQSNRPSLETVDPKDLGLSDGDISKYFGNVKELQTLNLPGYGSKTQILTVGFDDSEKLGLQNFEQLPTTGLSEQDKTISKNAFNQFQSLYGSNGGGNKNETLDLDHLTTLFSKSPKMDVLQSLELFPSAHVSNEISQQSSPQEQEQSKKQQNEEKDHDKNLQHQTFEGQVYYQPPLQQQPQIPYQVYPANFPHQPFLFQQPAPQFIQFPHVPMVQPQFLQYQQHSHAPSPVQSFLRNMPPILVSQPSSAPPQIPRGPPPTLPLQSQQQFAQVRPLTQPPVIMHIPTAQPQFVQIRQKGEPLQQISPFQQLQLQQQQFQQHQQQTLRQQSPSQESQILLPVPERYVLPDHVLQKLQPQTTQHQFQQNQIRQQFSLQPSSSNSGPSPAPSQVVLPFPQQYVIPANSPLYQRLQIPAQSRPTPSPNQLNYEHQSRPGTIIQNPPEYGYTAFLELLKNQAVQQSRPEIVSNSIDEGPLLYTANAAINQNVPLPNVHLGNQQFSTIYKQNQAQVQAPQLSSGQGQGKPLLTQLQEAFQAGMSMSYQQNRPGLVRPQKPSGTHYTGRQISVRRPLRLDLSQQPGPGPAFGTQAPFVQTPGASASTRRPLVFPEPNSYMMAPSPTAVPRASYRSQRNSVPLHNAQLQPQAQQLYQSVLPRPYHHHRDGEPKPSMPLITISKPENAMPRSRFFNEMIHAIGNKIA